MNKELTEIRARFYERLHENDEQLAKAKPGTKEHLRVIMRVDDIAKEYVGAVKLRKLCQKR